jgi:uncharacterized protein
VPPTNRPSLLARFFAAREPGPPEFLRAQNLTRNAEIGGRIEIAGTAGRRNKGLLGRARLNPGEGLWIVPCEAVHTFAMKFAIDLLYLDKAQRVVKVRHAVRPGRISGALRAHSVIELPAGTLAATQTQRGDQLQLERLSGQAS